MSSSDKSALDENAHPVKHGVARGQSLESDDDTLLVLRIEERQLMWIALAVLAVFVVINGFAILTRDTSGSGFNRPPPFEEGSHSFSPPGSERTKSGSAGDGAHSSAPGQGEKGPQDRAPRSDGGLPNNDSMVIVKGEEALSRVKAFATDFDLGKEDTDALIAVVEKTNAAIEAVDTQLASEEIDLATHSTDVQRQQDNQRLEILRIIGWQRSSNLQERLRSTAAGEPGGSSPPKSK